MGCSYDRNSPFLPDPSTSYAKHTISLQESSLYTPCTSPRTNSLPAFKCIMDDDQPYDEDFRGNDGLEPYRYTPITPGEIRCLVLEPGRGNESLSCTLAVYQLADNPPYEAISYVWGTASRCHKIRCDGRRLFITPNLRDALRQCRLPDSRRVLWADSVCINQDDKEEKSQQVRVMSEIYSQATRALICLGPDRIGGCAQQAQSFLHDFNDMFEKTLKEISGDWDSFPFPDDGSPLFSDSRWSSWDSLVEQPWFKRGWVVQEAGLAKDALLLWGKVRIDWLWIQRIVIWGSRRSAVSPSMPRSIELHLDMYRIRYQEEAITMWGEDDFCVDDLPDILDSARVLDVDDNRDRIYAFLGFPAATVVRDSLSINYEKTWETVFQDFACCYLDCTHDLRLLHYIQSTETTISSNSEYPSWIPQWQHNVYSGAPYRKWQEKIVSQHQTISPPYSRQENSILRVRGLIMDSITFLSPRLSRSTTISDMATVWSTFACHSSRPIYEKFPPLHAFWEAITAGSCPAGVSDTHLRAQERACMRRLDYGRQALGGKDIKTTSDGTEDELDNAGAMWQYIRKNIHNRRVAVTRRGYYCLVPSLSQEGDICAVIFETSLPFILRGAGRSRYYKVVGDTFVTSRQVDWEAGEVPYRVGSGIGANEDWLDMGLEEEDIWLC